MKATILSSGALLLVFSGLGAALPQEPVTESSSVEPLPTVGSPSLSTRPISLTPQPTRTRTRTTAIETTTDGTLTDSVTLSSTETASEPTSVTSVEPSETSLTLSLTSGTTLLVSSLTPSSPATVIPSSVGASATGSPNAAPTQFGPWKGQGIAALASVTTVFASMLFML